MPFHARSSAHVHVHLHSCHSMPDPHLIRQDPCSAHAVVYMCIMLCPCMCIMLCPCMCTMLCPCMCTMPTTRARRDRFHLHHATAQPPPHVTLHYAPAPPQHLTSRHAPACLSLASTSPHWSSAHWPQPLRLFALLLFALNLTQPHASDLAHLDLAHQISFGLVTGSVGASTGPSPRAPLAPPWR